MRFKLNKFVCGMCVCVGGGPCRVRSQLNKFEHVSRVPVTVRSKLNNFEHVRGEGSGWGRVQGVGRARTLHRGGGGQGLWPCTKGWPGPESSLRGQNDTDMTENITFAILLVGGNTSSKSTGYDNLSQGKG